MHRRFVLISSLEKWGLDFGKSGISFDPIIRLIIHHILCRGDRKIRYVPCHENHKIRHVLCPKNIRPVRGDIHGFNSQFFNQIP